MKYLKNIVVLLALGAVVFLTVNLSSRGKAEPTVNVSADLVDKNGQAVDLAAFRGKVVFINNWASWCPPCVAEMPSIQKLKNELSGEDIVFVMVSFDQQQKKAFAFLEKRKFDFDVYFPAEKYPFITESIPVTYILDKKGQVVFEKIGMANYDSPEIVAELRKLVSQ